MKKIVKNVVVLIASIIAVLMIVSQSLFNDPISLISIPIWIVEARKGIDEQKNKAIEIEEENRESNRILAENWVKDTYGATLSEVIKIEFSNRGQGWGTESIFHMESPFCTGSIFVDSETKKVEGGFNLQGKKFLHLYSNWVKKQVGIEDENVELKFGEAKKGSRMVGQPPFIDFKSITSIDNLEEQICENTHNLYVLSNTYGDPGVVIKVYNHLEKQEKLDYADIIEKKIKSKIFINNEDFVTSIDNKLFINFINVDNKAILSVCYNYDKNTKEYIDYGVNDNWIKYE